MTQTETIRERIVRTAQSLHDQGSTWQEAANKLDIGVSTLRRYRNNDEYKRGGSKSVGKTVRDKMNRGGKLTQLENNNREDKKPPPEKPPPRPPPKDPPEVPRGPTERVDEYADLVDQERPALIDTAINPVGKQSFPKLRGAIDEGHKMDVTIYEYDIPGTDNVRFEIGQKTSDALDLEDVHVLRFDLENFQDELELGSALWERFQEENFLGDT